MSSWYRVTCGKSSIFAGQKNDEVLLKGPVLADLGTNCRRLAGAIILSIDLRFDAFVCPPTMTSLTYCTHRSHFKYLLEHLRPVWSLAILKHYIL